MDAATIHMDSLHSPISPTPNMPGVPNNTPSLRGPASPGASPPLLPSTTPSPTRPFDPTGHMVLGADAGPLEKALDIAKEKESQMILNKKRHMFQQRIEKALAPLDRDDFKCCGADFCIDGGRNHEVSPRIEKWTRPMTAPGWPNSPLTQAYGLKRRKTIRTILGQWRDFTEHNPRTSPLAKSPRSSDALPTGMESSTTSATDMSTSEEDSSESPVQQAPSKMQEMHVQVPICDETTNKTSAKPDRTESRRLSRRKDETAHSQQTSVLCDVMSCSDEETDILSAADTVSAAMKIFDAVCDTMHNLSGDSVQDFGKKYTHDKDKEQKILSYLKHRSNDQIMECSSVKPPPYKCEHCPDGQVYSSYHEFHEHLKSENIPKPFRCACDIVFDKASGLLAHLHKNPDKCGIEIKCEICGENFENAFHRSAHLYFNKTGCREQFRCKICKQIQSYDDFRKHYDQHYYNGECVCRGCDERCDSVEAFVRHLVCHVKNQ